MNLNQARKICSEIEYYYKSPIKKIGFTDVYNSIDELINDLKLIYIPQNRIAPVGTFKGYTYIYSFATLIQNGKTLSDKQLTQCKRLALEIKKASAIFQYEF